MEVDRTADNDTVEKGVKNRWKWKWLEEKDANGIFLSDYIRKIKKPGFARCTICMCELKYASGGKKLSKKFHASPASRWVQNMCKIIHS